MNIKMNMIDLNEQGLEEFIEAHRKCYAKPVQNQLPLPEAFIPAYEKESNSLSLDILHDLSIDKQDSYFSSIVRRIELVGLLRDARVNRKRIDTEHIWKLIAESIRIVEERSIISSIGSQGFLSIPLFKSDEQIDLFEFVRLHIWDRSLEQYFDLEKSDTFSIHSHSFHAMSWILTGAIINERYAVEETSQASSHSLFKIEYNKTLNEVNQHVSKAVNTERDVILRPLSYEEHYGGNCYEIGPGEYHRSGCKSEHGIAATVFVFTTKGQVVQSHVTGPSSIKHSEINRKMYINPMSLLNQIERKIIANE